MALGKNLLVAIMPWEGHNYEDAIILSQRLVQDDVLTSIHIEEHEIDARDTKLGAGGDHPRHSRTSPRRSSETSTSAGSSGSGRRSPTGDILVGKVTPEGRDRADPRGAAAARDLRGEGP